MNGGLRLACSSERMMEIKHQAITASSFGLDMQIPTPREAQALWLLVNIDNVVGAAYLPTDGQTNPSDITRHWPKMQENEAFKLLRTAKSRQGRCKMAEGPDRKPPWMKSKSAPWSLLRTMGREFRNSGRGQCAADLGTASIPVNRTHYRSHTEPVYFEGPGPPDLLQEEAGGLTMRGHESNPLPGRKAAWRIISVYPAGCRLGPF